MSTTTFDYLTTGNRSELATDPKRPSQPSEAAKLTASTKSSFLLSHGPLLLNVKFTESRDHIFFPNCLAQYMWDILKIFECMNI